VGQDRADILTPPATRHQPKKEHNHENKIGWGHTWLDRFGTTGVTDSFQTRIQWIY
jgi:hypothetical protein